MGGPASIILEGFDIENWACIKKLTVTGLPPTGVVVLHGPNRTGKSSLVRALRACLLDYPANSTSKTLKACYPRGSGEKPTVSVVYSAGGTTYRIKKCFGSSKSELATRTSTGAWKVETTSASEAHSRVCECAGGDDSKKGLHQLLWLTQAEFRLPEVKDFDAGVQAQLRGILGVLQTPLDDRFIDRVKKRWNLWHSGQRKAGKQPQIKEGCTLSQNLSRMANVQEELNESELKFNQVESLLRETENLESRAKDLAGQLLEQKGKLQKCQEERVRSQGRISARKLAEERFANAEKEQKAANDERQQRADAAKRLTDAEKPVQPGKNKVETLEKEVHSMENKQAQRKEDLNDQRDQRRDLEQRKKRVAAKLRVQDDTENLYIAQKELKRAHEIAQGIDDLKKYLRENPAPDDAQLEALKTNRREAMQLQADRDAASMVLKLVPIEGAGPARLVVDGAPLQPPQDSSQPLNYSVRRKAELLIPLWGQVELTRGTSQGDLNQIEADLTRLNEEFTDSIAPFGITGSDPDAFDQLLRRSAEQALKNDELKKQERELKKLAPKGLEPLQGKVLELETKLKSVAAAYPKDAEALPAERKALEDLETELTNQIEALDDQIQSHDAEIESEDTELGQARTQVTKAKAELAGFEATVSARCEELDRLRTDEQIAQRVGDAERDLKETERQLTDTQLTTEESTIDERLAAWKESVGALEQQIRENDEKYNRMKGRLEESEGLHSRRAACAARFEELTRLTDRESLEKDAVDRLYELFEQCRDKQLGTLMGPIHDRVLNWLRVLDIGDYKEIRFNDAFLPDKLVRRDGTAEFTIDEESTGAQEQIGMLVRLSLGSLLTSINDPTVAILDDPLTHCDVGRLNRMRAILRRASEGDGKLTPPAGPLQIIVLTCHPEWFRDERATVVDLENLDVMQRFPV
jgi:DNA repair exonuclease SbcCD ATPase subunit